MGREGGVGGGGGGGVKMAFFRFSNSTVGGLSYGPFLFIVDVQTVGKGPCGALSTGTRIYYLLRVSFVFTGLIKGRRGR